MEEQVGLRKEGGSIVSNGSEEVSGCQTPSLPWLCPLRTICCWAILTMQEEATAKDGDKESDEPLNPQNHGF